MKLLINTKNTMATDARESTRLASSTPRLYTNFMEPGEAKSDAQHMARNPEGPSEERLWQRLRRPIIEKILHLDDTPHRIALGVFLGFVVGWTPLMGAQIVLYLAAAYLFRANRASGLPPVLLTNPITAVPIYMLNWRIGQWLLNPGGISEAAREKKAAALTAFVEKFSISEVFTASFWDRFADAFGTFGQELFFGCLVVGGVCGLLGYIATYYGVVAYRRRRATKQARKEESLAESAGDLAA